MRKIILVTAIVDVEQSTTYPELVRLKLQALG